VNDACINAHLPKVWSDIELNGVHNAFDERAAAVHETAVVADIGKPDGVTRGAPRNVDQHLEPRLAALLWSDGSRRQRQTQFRLHATRIGRSD